MKNDLAEISTKYSNVPEDEMFYSKGKNAYLKFTKESEWGWCFNEDSKQVLEIPVEIWCRSDGWKSLDHSDREDDGDSSHTDTKYTHAHTRVKMHFTYH